MNSLDHLKADLTQMISHVKSLPPDPTEEQLQSKVKSLATAIKNEAKASSAIVKEIVTKGFTSFGFDISKMEVSDHSSFKLSGLIAGLTSISDGIEKLDASIALPSDQEVGSLALACEKLWELDANRLVPEKDYAINLQGGKKAYAEGDIASEPLFSFVREETFKRPTFKSFISLLDNYVSDLGKLFYYCLFVLK